ncbi:MAG: L-aspartate oxidase, partial [Hyphomicrobiaceae bacterium]
VFELLPARAVVLATGGIGALYAVTTNPAYARGEAIAFAARAGAVIADAEFVQFHPTALDVGADPAPLASEALRGEGAVLINSEGQRFMRAAHVDAELAPRDVVARAVFSEIAAGRRVFLDCREAIGAHFPKLFPTVYAHCRAAGIDPVRMPIPVAPAEHYHMGGIETDANGRTSVSGLWAVGEVASTGLHGANRLASNSLLEAVVFAARAAEDIARSVASGDGLVAAKLHAAEGLPEGDPSRRRSQVAEIRRIMAEDVGVVRNRRSLQRALAALVHVAGDAEGDVQLSNMALAARFVAAAALKRRESRGGHYRSDYPEAAPALACRSRLTLADLTDIEAAVLATVRDRVPESWVTETAAQHTVAP